MSETRSAKPVTSAACARGWGLCWRSENMLSEQAMNALQDCYDEPLMVVSDLASVLAREMLRLYPPGWSDPVTPERLVELGGAESPTGISFELYGDVMYGGVPVRFEFRQSGLEVRVPSRKWLPTEAKPRNMQEARQLLERCGAIKEPESH